MPNNHLWEFAIPWEWQHSCVLSPTSGRSETRWQRSGALGVSSLPPSSCILPSLSGSVAGGSVFWKHVTLDSIITQYVCPFMYLLYVWHVVPNSCEEASHPCIRKYIVFRKAARCFLSWCHYHTFFEVPECGFEAVFGHWEYPTVPLSAYGLPLEIGYTLLQNTWVLALKSILSRVINVISNLLRKAI